MARQVFTSSDTFTVPEGVTNLDYILIVAGGGGGGRRGAAGGGGGAGGVLLLEDVSVTPEENISVTVGSGGAGATTSVTGGSGGNSSFGSHGTATGGGGGSGGAGQPAASGGSGGGGGGVSGVFDGGSGTVGQGNDGGDGAEPSGNSRCGGGGGAGGAGSNGVLASAGNGGAGINLGSIVGTDVGVSGWFAGGGGGGAQGSTPSGGASSGGQGGGAGGMPSGTSGTPGGAATANTGSGGGGGGAGTTGSSTTAGNGGNGGSGIVIVVWDAEDPPPETGVQIEEVASASDTGPAVDTLDMTIDISGEDRYLLVAATFNNNDFQEVESVLLDPGGGDQTSLGLLVAANEPVDGDDGRAELWGIVNPPQGSFTVRVTLDAAIPGAQEGIIAGAWALSNVHQSSPVRDTSTQGSTTTSNNVVVDSEEDDLVLGAAFAENGSLDNWNVAPVGPAETDWDIEEGGDQGVGAHRSAEAGSSTTLGFTSSVSDVWIAAAASITPADSEPAPPDVEFSLIGAVTDSSATVKMRLDNVSGTPNLKVSTSSDLSDPVEVEGESIADDVWQFETIGLSADTLYHYGFASEKFGQFRTFPEAGQPANFTVAAASCNQTSSNAASFERIQDREPALFIHMGDWGYPDITTNNVGLYRTNYKNNLGQTRQHNMFANVPMTYSWDDHDFGPNNSTGSHVGKPAAQQAYREYVPHYELPADTRPGGDGEIYHTFAIGRIRFIILDCKSERSEEDDPDDEDKTTLGADQKQWLKDTLSAATEPVIVLEVSEPWIDSSGEDGWGMYATERQELCDFFEANNLMPRILLLHGDAHMLAADDGTNTNYATGASSDGPPLFNFAPLHQTNSTKGGPYSEGTHTGSQTQYGTLEFVDDEDTITVTGRGWEVDGESETNVLTMQVVFSGELPAPQPVGWWTLDDGTGSTAADSSGNNLDGILTGTANWTDGAVGGALEFNGSNNIVTVADNSLLDLTTSLTVSAWIKPSTVATQTILSKHGHDATNGYELTLSAGDAGQIVFMRFNQNTSGNTYRINSTTQYPADGNTWMHVAGTYDGTTMRIYINGLEEDDIAGPASISTNGLGLVMGQRSAGTAVDFFAGAMDDVRVYGIALSAEQIALLAQQDPDPLVPAAIAGTSTASLVDPVDRAGKGQHWQWWTGSRWDAVLPTAAGWRFFTDLTGSPVQGPVVDNRQDSRVDTLWHQDSLWVLRGHDTTPQITRYLPDNGSYAADSNVNNVTIAALIATNHDASPAVLCRTPNGRLWAAVNNGNNVVVAISDDNGETWDDANVLSVSATGVVMLTYTAGTVVLISTLNDGGGRAVRTIAENAGSITAGNWASESLPALPGGITSDDHGMAIAVGSQIYAVSKTTGSSSSGEPLLYLLHRDGGGTWTSHTLRPGPDDTGDTRPTLVAHSSSLYIAHGRNEDPTNARTQIVNRHNLQIPSPEDLFTSGDFWDGVVVPRTANSQSGLLWLAHDQTTETIWRVLWPLSGSSGIYKYDGTRLQPWLKVEDDLIKLNNKLFDNI